MVDVAAQVNAVQRALARGPVPQPESAGTTEGTVLVMSQTYDTDQDDLWDAVTDPERVTRWLMPLSGDLRPGGSYQLTGNAGGQILACDAPERFGVTWEFGGQVSWLDVVLSADGPERTRLELRHTAQVTQEWWDQFGPGAVGIGWDSMLLALALHVAGTWLPEGTDPQTWPMTDEGREFMGLSSEQWRRANVDFGTSEEAAQEAAERILAMYTGAEG